VQRKITPTLDSIKIQSFKNFEVIVIDDGSSDKTFDVLEEYTRNFNMNIIRQKNKGLGGARNAGIKASKGEYIAFLDADDLWKPEKLKQVHDTILAFKADLICHDEDCIRGGQIVSVLRHGPHIKYYDLLFKGNCLSPSAVTVRRQVLFDVGLFSEDRKGHGVEDYDLWMRLAKGGCVFHYLHKILGTYVLHSNNMSVENDFYHKINYVFEKHVAFLEDKDIQITRLIKQTRGVNFMKIGWSAMKNRDFSTAMIFYCKAINIKGALPGITFVLLSQMIKILFRKIRILKL
jgi:glycosyltransferase involved in cell wall biosynthesis